MRPTNLPGGCNGAADAPAINEVSLRAEILFWRELIETCPPDQPASSRERMQQALALAESKLRSLYAAHRDAGAAGGRARLASASVLRLRDTNGDAG
jgi:hypothetical protein